MEQSLNTRKYQFQHDSYAQPQEEAFAIVNLAPIMKKQSQGEDLTFEEERDLRLYEWSALFLQAGLHEM